MDKKYFGGSSFFTFGIRVQETNLTGFINLLGLVLFY